MFRKLHIEMTLFSTLVTGAILLVMTVICLFISENGAKKNDYVSFQNNAQTCLSYLENQLELSHQWLLQAKTAYNVEFEILDNGEPLFFDKLNPNEEARQAFQEARRISRESWLLDLDFPRSSLALTQDAFFSMKGYYACTALIPRSGGILSAVILHPLTGLQRRLAAQRLAFLAVVCCAVLALAVFSWFFTKKMIRPLEESRRRQTDFIASASHELRSPLAVIQSGAAALEKASPAEAGRFLSLIQGESVRMSRLVNDMLTLANADNRSWQFSPENCELDTLLLETCEKYETLARDKGISLSVRLPEAALPPCRCDASRIAQVLAVFLDNAISYVPAPGSVTLSLTLEKSFFHIAAADDGPGIPDSLKEEVFRRFYRADAARNDKQHFGLGLCIAREIAQMHHGSVSVTDTPGGGATFHLRLPAV